MQMSTSQKKPLLYVGENLVGTTSCHRREILEELIAGNAEVVDFNSFLPSDRLLRSVFWRFHNKIRLSQFNNELRRRLEGIRYHVGWIDKGMFLTESSLLLLKRQCEVLIFFTPDCFFFKNNVLSVERNLDLFDAVVTTKSFEMDRFRNCLRTESALHIVRQGYTPMKRLDNLKPLKRDIDVLFIGKYEESRGRSVQRLAESGVLVHVGGAGWGKKRGLLSKENIIFIGDDLRGEMYWYFYHRAKIGLGFISKEFPELHTTRTFEIPYYGTALATEKNVETSVFFEDDEVIFYDSDQDLCSKVITCLNTGAWKRIGESGSMRMRKGGFSWRDQLVSVWQSVVIHEITTI